MAREEAAKLIAQCKELRGLALTMKSEPNRKLLMETADKFEKVALQSLQREKD